MDIIVADDHKMFRDVIQLLLHSATEHKVIADADNVEDMLTAVSAMRADMVICDYRMPGSASSASVKTLEAVVQMKTIQKDLKVIVLTGVNSGYLYKNIVASGCDGLVIKEANSNELLDAINTIEEGGFYISATAQQLIDENDLPDNQLSLRELEVINLLVDGLNGPMIAKKLNISAKTVENHRTSIMKKLQVKNVIQLISLARKKGLYLS